MIRYIAINTSVINYCLYLKLNDMVWKGKIMKEKVRI